MKFSDVCCFVADCEVENVLYPVGQYGLWWYTAFVTLKSADDVDKALAKHGRYMGKSVVKGYCFILG